MTSRRYSRAGRGGSGAQDGQAMLAADRRRDGSGSAGDEGQVTVLALGYAVLTLLVVTVVLGVSAVYLEHKRLLSLADAAAVAAAGSFTLAQETSGATGPGVRLQSERVQAAAREHLARSPEAERFSGLTLGPGTGSPDGRTAVVELTAAAHPPLVNFLVPAGIQIEAISDARARLTR
ncbi:hypothetical protein BN1051_01987 [Arthrobacter saudimassiliensis]|uniref:Putative Flp pilus-assembly TadG-like N-terminal domain-containing protein n=1 Tax=Arthrobacter saudimassiliensis TaxID=1461584 RepID=A0A078MQU8_9MICC|nr:hypothetical protein BN1051_01987 [Arthrobacter saudimassiliensis]